MISKKGLIALVLVGAIAIGGGLGIGTYAYFTAQASSAVNSITLGTLAISANGMSEEYKVKVNNMYPGFISEAQIVTVSNIGSLPLRYKITGITDVTKNSNNEPVSSGLYNGVGDDTNILEVKINDGEWHKINNVSTESLGNIEPGSTGTFTIKYKLPENAGNGLQAQTGSFTINIIATQTSRVDAGWGEVPEVSTP